MGQSKANASYISRLTATSNIRRWIVALAFLVSPLAHANQIVSGFCQTGGQKVVTVGMFSTNLVQGSYPGCSVQVNISGGGLATIFDVSGNPLSNPFTASSTTAFWQFQAANGTYDITMSGGTPPFPAPLTIFKVILFDPSTAVLSQSQFVGSAFISSSANPASAGIFRAASSDNAFAFRNNANSNDLFIKKSGAASGNLPADVLDVSLFGGVKASQYFSPNANQSATGIFSCAASDTCVSIRNQANSADISAIAKDSSDRIVVGGVAGLSTAGINDTGNATITGTMGVTGATTLGTLTTQGITASAEVAPNVTGVQLGDTAHRWDLFVRNLDVSTIISTFNPTAINQTAPIYPSTAGDVCTNLIASAAANPTGAEMFLPAGVFTCSASSYTWPNDGTPLPNQPSFRIKGVSGDCGSVNANGLGKIPNTGTIIKFTGTAPGSGGRFNFLGQGQIEFTGVTLQETVGGVPPVFWTNTILDFHNNCVYGPTFAWISTTATRVQTTGGAGNIKLLIDLGAGTNGVNYRYFMYVKNQGAGQVQVNNNQGTFILIPAGVTKSIAYTQVNDGSHLELAFATASVGDAMDVIAQFPTVAGHGGADANLISGASLTFGGSWVAQGGAALTLTQNQTVTQRPVTDGLLAGGNNNTFGGGLTDSYQGYRSAIVDNHFNRVRSAVALTLNANKMKITGNHIWVESGSDLQGAIDCVGGCGGNDINGNNIEVPFYKYGLWGHGAALVGSSFDNNSCYDPISPTPFVSCYNFESGSSGNLIKHSCGNEGFTDLPHLITEGTPGQNTVVSTCGNQFAQSVRLASTIQNIGATSTMGLTLKKGSGGGNYSTASTTFVQVDGTNLTLTITIPTGWKLKIDAVATGTTNTGVASNTVVIADGGSTLISATTAPGAAGNFNSVSLTTIINGDGAAHTIDLRYKTSNAADSAVLLNTTAVDTPQMTFTLMPSN